LEQSVIDNNIRVLRRIAQILNKFRDYTIVIEGHAHNISGTEAEETSTVGGNIPLIPLSKDRSEFVKRELVRLGVSAGRMTTEGAGGRKPVANRANRDDWWKDRRVEFILNK
jgi:outer membrane protein OmpA-like peptidoglycan-associated protein